jgi:hypothetical protein
MLNLFLYNNHVYLLINVVFFNPLNAKLNPMCHLLALLEAHHILHVSRIKVTVVSFGHYMSKPSDWSKIWSILWSVLLETWEACSAVCLNHGDIMILLALIPSWVLGKERNHIMLNLANREHVVCCVTALWGQRPPYIWCCLTIFTFFPTLTYHFILHVAVSSSYCLFSAWPGNWFLNFYLGLGK